MQDPAGRDISNNRLSHLEPRLLLSELGNHHIAPCLQEAVPHVVAVDCGKPEAPEGGVVMAVVRHDMHHWEVQGERQSKPAVKKGTQHVC